MKVEFIVPGQPQGKARARTVRDRRGNVHSYTPEATVQYESLIALEWRGTHSLPFPKDVPISMEIEAVFRVPTSYTKKKQQLAITGKIYPTVKVDVDNCAKSIMDGLQGEAFPDDKQVVSLYVKKRYAAENEEPHVKVCLSDVQI